MHLTANIFLLKTYLDRFLQHRHSVAKHLCTSPFLFPSFSYTFLSSVSRPEVDPKIWTYQPLSATTKTSGHFRFKYIWAKKTDYCRGCPKHYHNQNRQKYMDMGWLVLWSISTCFVLSRPYVFVVCFQHSWLKNSNLGFFFVFFSPKIWNCHIQSTCEVTSE